MKRKSKSSKNIRDNYIRNLHWFVIKTAFSIILFITSFGWWCGGRGIKLIKLCSIRFKRI